LTFFLRLAFSIFLSVLGSVLIGQRGRTNDLPMILIVGSFFTAPFALVVAAIAFQLEKTFLSMASGPIVAALALGVAFLIAPNRENFMAGIGSSVVQVALFGTLWSVSAWVFAAKANP